MRFIIATLIMLLAWPTLATPLDEILDIDSGQVSFHFDSRDDVWGVGRNISIGDPEDLDRRRWRQGPVHLLIELTDGEVDDVEIRIGEEPRPHRGSLRDFGELSPTAASELLLDLAERGRGPELDALILPATLARDVGPWRRLLAMARSKDLDDEVARQAVFWLGQSAAHRATSGLRKLLEDHDVNLEIKEHALFALSQGDDDEAFDVLVRIARDNLHPQLREQAIFWMGQLDDPRALLFFESILLGD